MVYLLFMLTAFMGYILPWGQMSFWGATVITNLISVIPYLGKELVEWVWGVFSVKFPTLSQFFFFHFLLPIISTVLVMIHIFLLHLNGSSNPLGLMPNSDKIEFHPFFSYKDMLSLVFSMSILVLLSVHLPNLFMDSDNFMIANLLNTPEYIQPEWYFLFAHCILQSITSKIGGVLGLVFSILILMLPLMSTGVKKGFLSKVANTLQVMSFMMLTWLGSLPVESSFVILSMVTSMVYFIPFGMLMLLLSMTC